MKKYISKKRIIWGVLGILGILGLLGRLGKLEGLKNKTYLVTEVIDGDTIKIKDKKLKIKNLIFGNGENEVLDIRYIGIDTPELAKGEKKDECYAEKAKKINEKLLLGKKVRIETDKNELDNYGRTLAYVYMDEIFINQYLLEQGVREFFLDTVNLKYQNELIKAAEKGYKEKQGLWNDCAPDNKGCVIKGNLDKQDKKWYHLPYFRHYNQVVIRLDSGDRWFCTEENAIEAGFEKARE